MRIIISPAKKMQEDVDGLPYEHLPQFLPEAELLLDRLRGMSDQELKKLWNCNDIIASLNLKRLKSADLRQRLTPAILSYDGIQYQYMAPGVLETEQLNYIQTHLRILSGFYGLLRPFDGVIPYRLEMQARLDGDGYQNLYAFWGARLARQLCAETDLIVNLASKEYSKCISPCITKTTTFLSCEFGALVNGRLIQKGTQCKMARGAMVRFLAEHRVNSPDQIKAFDRLGYAYCEERSTEHLFVFLK